MCEGGRESKRGRKEREREGGREGQGGGSQGEREGERNVALGLFRTSQEILLRT